MNEDTRRFVKPISIALVALLVVGAVLLGALAVNAVKAWDDDSNDNMGAQISIQGTGEIFAVPDIATFTFTVNEKGATVKAAQDKATAKSNSVLAYLKDAGIEEKDIKTTSYNINPQYEYRQTEACTNFRCPPGKQVLTGYEVSQTIEVKVRDAGKAGDILSGIGGIGASYVSGLQFTIDDEETIKAQARDAAIANAKEKADKLASKLGISLGKITSFYENQGGYPMYDVRSSLKEGASGAMNQSAPASPELPSGENKYVSSVTITYKIK